MIFIAKWAHYWQKKLAEEIIKEQKLSVALKNITTHNTPPIDLHVLWPIIYAWAS